MIIVVNKGAVSSSNTLVFENIKKWPLVHTATQLIIYNKIHNE